MYENSTEISNNSNGLKNMCHTKISIKEENLSENQQYEEEEEGDYYFNDKQETAEDEVYEANQIKLEKQESENEIHDVGNDSVDFNLYNQQDLGLSNSREDNEKFI